MPATPSRIWIVGHTGSGKSTLAAALAARLGLTPIHLDEHFWLPGWQETPFEEFREKLGPLVARERWVVEGNYKGVRRHFWDRADLVVWLDLPLHVTFPRVLLRTFRRWRTRERICNGNVESLRTTFLSRDSILWWSLSRHWVHRWHYERECVGRPHVRLRSARAVREWLASVGRG